MEQVAPFNSVNLMLADYFRSTNGMIIAVSVCLFGKSFELTERLPTTSLHHPSKSLCLCGHEYLQGTKSVLIKGVITQAEISSLSFGLGFSRETHIMIPLCDCCTPLEPHSYAKQTFPITKGPNRTVFFRMCQ